MIFGTGIDIIEVDRVGEKILKDGFREMVFSPAEVAFCDAKKDRFQNYAARFAAKEAFLKATGLGLTAGHELHDIEITNDDLGKPAISLKGSFQKLALENGWKKIHLSLSHVKTMACAVVVIEK